MAAGIYVHIPFCSSKCIYCDFYSRVRSDWDVYADALGREAIDRKEYLKGVPPTTLYFGGGTPSILPSSVLKKIYHSMAMAFDLSSVDEFTVEVNPDDVTPEKISCLKEIGVNRVSMGVQSFDDGHLAWMGRRHSAEEAEEAFGRLRSAGFANISMDLIFGFSMLSDKQWSDNIDRALALRPEHISCYQMMGRYADESQDRCWGQYRTLQEKLSAAGYIQYEVSNYCLPGHQSRHNSAYWSREPYLGLGAGAHSFDGERRRSWNISSIDSYLESRPYGSEYLRETDIFEETVMLSLRTVRGLDLSALDSSRVNEMKPALERLSKAGYIVFDGQSVRIPAERLFVSDYVISELFPQ